MNFTQKKYNSLEELESEALKCQKCALAKTRTKVVLYDGNPEAKLLIIGEGPGEQEDLSGCPFVGRAGQLLDKILACVDIDRQRDTYICNVVKCRPPKNRLPKPEEALVCMSYLEEQIRLVDPKIILLLGSTALKYVLNLKEPRITKLHGIWLEEEKKPPLLANKKVMPFFHPSYLLRNQSRLKDSPKWRAWQAIKEVKKNLNLFQA